MHPPAVNHLVNLLLEAGYNCSVTDDNVVTLDNGDTATETVNGWWRVWKNGNYVWLNTIGAAFVALTVNNIVEPPEDAWLNRPRREAEPRQADPEQAGDVDEPPGLIEPPGLEERLDNQANNRLAIEHNADVDWAQLFLG